MAAHHSSPAAPAGADLQPLLLGLLLLGARLEPTPAARHCVHHGGLPLDPSAPPRRQPATTSAAVWGRPHDLAVEQHTGSPSTRAINWGTMRYPPRCVWSPVLAAGLCFAATPSRRGAP